MKSSFSFSHLLAVLSLMAVVTLFLSSRFPSAPVEQAGSIECRFDSDALRIRCAETFH